MKNPTVPTESTPAEGDDQGGPTADDGPGAPATAPPPARSELLGAVALLFGGTGCIALLAALVPAVGGYGQALLAALLVAVPWWVLRRRGLTVDHPPMGVTMAPWPRALGWAGLAVLLTHPPFLLGFHVLSTEVRDRELAPSWASLARYGDAVEEPPDDACALTAPTGTARPTSEGRVQAWLGPDGLWVVGPPRARVSVEVRAEGLTTAPATAVHCAGRGPVSGGRLRVAPVEGGGIAVDARRRGASTATRGVRIALGRPDALDIAIAVDGVPVPAERLRLGRWSEPAPRDGGFDAALGHTWLLALLVVHLGLVALPEEWFFRGYLQPRLDQRFGAPWRLFGAHVGWGLVLSSLAFALLHPILVPGPHRLLVFFPSLAFGWLRARSGGIGAPVLYHAACNVLITVAGRLYA